MALRAPRRDGAHFATPCRPAVGQRLLHLVVPGGHDHDHGHVHGHGHGHGTGDARSTCAEGLRTVWVSVAFLAFTAIVQAVVVVASGSVALLGDSLHNVADALTALPLAVAFVLGRRPPSARYTYGYGRAEDLAGIAVVV